MKVSEMFPSRFLRAEDLKAPVVVTVAGVKVEKMHKPGVGDVDGWVIYFEKASRGIVLSKGLAMSIAAALGEQDTEAWPGRQVVLFPQQMTVAGRQLVAIRARSVAQPVPANGKA